MLKGNINKNPYLIPTQDAESASILGVCLKEMKLEVTPQEIIATMHAHPTLSEALWEAVLDVTGETIHFYSR